MQFMPRSSCPEKVRGPAVARFSVPVLVDRPVLISGSHGLRSKGPVQPAPAMLKSLLSTWVDREERFKMPHDTSSFRGKPKLRL